MGKYKKGSYPHVRSQIRDSVFHIFQFDALVIGRSLALPIYYEVSDTLFELTNLTGIGAAYVQRNLSTDLESDLPS